MSAFIDSGAGLVLSMACFTPSILSSKNNCKVNNVGVYLMNGQIVYTCKSAH